MHRPLLRQVIALSGLLFPVLAFAQVAVSPASPKMLDIVRLQITQAGTFVYDLDATTVAMADNTITVTVRNGGAISPPPPPRVVEFFLGQFPVGGYAVNVSEDQGTNRVPVGSTTFTVTARSAASDRPVFQLSDLWWNPDQSGWGLNIVQHASGNLFMTWFVYGALGQPLWYVVPGGTWTSDRTFTGTVYRTSGPVFGDSFDASAVKRTVAGSVTAQFRGTSSGNVTFQVDGQTTVSAISRQPY
jgi:hypothetical protein